MKKSFLAFLLIAATPLCTFAASDRVDLNERLEKATLVIEEIMKTPDRDIPDSVMRNAMCVAVIPRMKKGAFVVGAQYGQGVVTCRTHMGWSAPVFIRAAGGSYGFQIGGQATDVVLVAVNEKGMQDLLKDKFKIGADASATAGPVGRDAQASTDIKLGAELLTYSRSKGLFAGIDLDGTSISQNREDTEVFYGGSYSFEHILHGGVPPPSGSMHFLHAIARYSHSSHEKED